jgi:two-component system response regulator
MTKQTEAKPITILLVEDNPGDADLARDALESSKFTNELFVVEDGVEAMSFLKNEKGYQDAPRPDLIILDLNLPKKDGREVLAEIKTDKRLKTIPVVILTTSDADEDVLKSYELHANCYITKPLNLNQFFKVIKSINTFWMSIVVLPPAGGR